MIPHCSKNLSTKFQTSTQKITQTSYFCPYYMYYKLGLHGYPNSDKSSIRVEGKWLIWSCQKGFLYINVNFIIMNALNYSIWFIMLFFWSIFNRSSRKWVFVLKNAEKPAGFQPFCSNYFWLFSLFSKQKLRNGKLGWKQIKIITL